jgi:hypothetical protein
LGYHVVYDTTGDDWEYVPASRMLHVKANVPRNVKRGVSDLYWIANDVQREAKIRRNTADGAALQAAIAWFREHAQGTTTSAVQSMVDGQAIDIRQQRTSSGTRPTRQGKLRSGTVVDIPETMKDLPGPMGSERNSNFILIAQYVARAIAARWAMPEFMFTSDASNANYASTLVAESPFVKAREADQRFYGQAFVELLWKVLRLAHEIGRAFQNIEKFDDLQQILELTATGPRVSNRDELQTVQRQQIEVSMGTLSLETAAAEMGRDLAKEQAKGAHPAGQAPLGSAQASGSTAPNASPMTESKAADQAEFSDTVGRRFRKLERRISLFEFDHNHDSKGRFAHSPGGGGGGVKKKVVGKKRQEVSGNQKRSTRAEERPEYKVKGLVARPSKKDRSPPPRPVNSMAQTPGISATDYTARAAVHGREVVDHVSGSSRNPTPNLVGRVSSGPKKSSSSNPRESIGKASPSSKKSRKDLLRASDAVSGSKMVGGVRRWFNSAGEQLPGTKPSHAPTPKKWKDKGGRITVDKGGTWTYHLGKHSVSYPGGHPDFEKAGYVVHTAKGRFKGNHTTDYTAANEDYARNRRHDQPETVDASVTSWHHYHDLTKMQAVPSYIHRLFTHIGGVANRKRKKAK